MIKQDRDDHFADHFARVVPLVGMYLRERLVALVGMAAATMLAEYLAACSVRRWLLAPGPATDAFERRLEGRHGTALAAELTRGAVWPAAEAADLVIAVGGPCELRQAAEYASRTHCPALLAGYHGGGWSAWVQFPGCERGTLDWVASLPVSVSIGQPPDDRDWDLVTILPLLAGLARALLLRGTPYQRGDLEELWQAGQCQLSFSEHTPLQITWQAGGPVEVPAGSPFRSPAVGPGSVLVAGLGSIGSVAAAWLAHTATSLVLVDPDRVERTNPVRQAFQIADVGAPKAHALAARLHGSTRTAAYHQALCTEAQVAQLVARHGIRAALVATGTSADFAIARGLRACGVPHVVARCYPRALYWEAIVVDGMHGPAFDEIRSYVAPGPAAAPTPEQLAAYSDAGALEAEPATLVESGWAAAWASRLTAQCLQPEGLRERWFLELVRSGYVCLVGGVAVQHTPQGPAYGVSLPGQIHAWRNEHIQRSSRHA